MFYVSCSFSLIWMFMCTHTYGDASQIDLVYCFIIHTTARSLLRGEG